MDVKDTIAGGEINHDIRNAPENRHMVDSHLRLDAYAYSIGRIAIIPHWKRRSRHKELSHTPLPLITERE